MFEFLGNFYNENRYLVSNILKLLFIVFIAMVLGLNREKNHSPIGVKTLMVIGITSCILTIISIDNADRYVKETGLLIDSMRVPAQIVSGIGFLGAGVIFIRKDKEINGLTTAAMIWGVATLGIAVGLGYVLITFLALIFMILAVEIFPKVVNYFGLNGETKYVLSLGFIEKEHLLNCMNDFIDNSEVYDYDIFDYNDKHEMEVTIYIKNNNKKNLNDIYNRYSRIEGLKKIIIK